MKKRCNFATLLRNQMRTLAQVVKLVDTLL